MRSVDALQTEDGELKFVTAFRKIMRVKNILVFFADFKWEDLAMNNPLFEDYKSKYLDLYDKVKSNHQKEKVSILEDVDFELELIHRDEILALVEGEKPSVLQRKKLDDRILKQIV